MKLDVADYIELKDGGAVVVFEMDEEAREGLICEAIKSRILAGLEQMEEVVDDKEEGYLEDLADMEAGRRMDTVEPTYTSPLPQRMDEG